MGNEKKWVNREEALGKDRWLKRMLIGQKRRRNGKTKGKNLPSTENQKNFVLMKGLESTLF